ncbi:AIR synthase related protein [Thermoproteus tenax]|uniref:Thiamine monophosphate kinase n=1 Tax=Thermoproteus tenax (strain ATCC 35583 / DSM 2078 / JCM 9277 / NBRC 100435 / Kra 1) TaxID=768679 RepID=G4RM60_THETK|nr:AIR synthase related protein [Thermoproteus tenax]CCC82655.1 Thiamine monophosphate kinase [Thermoproteus tenax Kra 1]
MDEKSLLRTFLRELGEEENDVSYIDGLALKVDGFAESYAKMPFHTYADMGWRAVAAALSDMKVKLAHTKAVLSSITAPEPHKALEVFRGILEAATHFGVRYLGGDLNQGVEVVVDIMAVGTTAVKIGRRPRAGHVLITPPLFGYTGLAFAAFEHDGESPIVAKGIRWLKRPSLDWPPPPPPECISASMDSSDGLADVLLTMAKGVDIVVERLPAPQEVISEALRLGFEPEEVVFNAGEEYLPVFAVDPRCVPEGYVAFARVVEGSGSVIYKGKPLKYRGWSYFR